MTLFEECKEALATDFFIVNGQNEKDALDILNTYPLVNGNISWSEIEYSDYEDISNLLSVNPIENDSVFVFVDDADIPIFRSNLSLISENIYDVTALSPKIFIFNNNVILHPLFPTELFRLGIKTKE
jgi:hypothetical protein